MIAIPKFSLFGKRNDQPHNAHTLEVRDWPNEHGTLIRYEVRENRRGTAWWLYALYPGKGKYPHEAGYESSFRASATMRTTSRITASEWVLAVRKGEVAVDD